MSKLDPAVNELVSTTRLRRVTAGAQVFYAMLVDRPRKASAWNENHQYRLTEPFFKKLSCKIVKFKSHVGKNGDDVGIIEVHVGKIKGHVGNN
ncbi:MAG: hypothetical protein WBB47_00885 [Paenisporosarcina sp.]